MRSFNRAVFTRKEKYALAADKINECITMREVADFYSIDIHRGDFVCCPFHAGDRTASLKLYGRRWYCFGCKRGGSVVDFVKAYEQVGFFAAVEKCDIYFSLNLNLGEHTTFYQNLCASRDLKCRRAEQVAKDVEYKRLLENYTAAFDRFVVADCIIFGEAPTNESQITDRFANALKRYAEVKHEFRLAEYALSDYEAKYQNARAI